MDAPKKSKPGGAPAGKPNREPKPAAAEEAAARLREGGSWYPDAA